MKRREAREQAFLLVFEQGITGESIDASIDAAGMSRDVIVDDFAEHLAKGVETHCSEVDEVISRYTRGWQFQRLSRVAVAALRLAITKFGTKTKFPAVCPSMKPWNWPKNTAVPKMLRLSTVY